MATKSSAGWVILAAALAVPGFLFFQWYSRLDAQKKAEIERHVRRNLPKDAALFASAPGGEKLNNPIAPGAAPAVGLSSSPASGVSAGPAVGAAAVNAAAAAALATAAAQPNAASGLRPGAPASAPAAPAPPSAATAPIPQPPAGAPVSAASGGPSPAPAPSAPQAAPSAGFDASSSSSPAGDATAFGSLVQTAAIKPIVLARDPMLSPFDMVRIAEDELRRRRAQDEIEAAANPKRRRGPAEKPAESLVDLQGIVSTGEGDKAIVNGEMVGEGDLVAGKIKVVKITPTGVVFLYHSRRFVKGISK